MTTTQRQGQAPAHLFVMFGATGDLARRKLLPAVFRLTRAGHLSNHAILAVARNTEHDDQSYRRWAREALGEAGVSPEDLAGWCDDCLNYQPISADADTYQVLARRIEAIEAERGLPGNRIFYLAVPPKAFPGAVGSPGTELEFAL